MGHTRRSPSPTPSDLSACPALILVILCTSDALQVHAEANAILNRNAASLRGCTAYVALFPCNECCKLIIQSGIKEVVYVSDKYHDTTPMKASRRMLELAGVVYRQYLPPEGKITIDFSAAL